MKNALKLLSLGFVFALSGCAFIDNFLGNENGTQQTGGNQNEQGGGNESGSNGTFIMEAEYVDFTNLIGGGNSVEKYETSMIYGEGTDEEKAKGWSNGYFVAYTHKTGVKLTFNFTSSAAVTGATLVVRMASEMGEISVDPDSFEIKMNDQVIDYSSQYLNNYGTLEEMRFTDKTITSNLSIKEGANTLTLEVLENSLTGGTTVGPIIDCVKITSKATLSWEPLVDNPDTRGDI